MSRVEKAVDEFASGANCAESVVVTYAGEFGIDREHALKLACGLGGGLGRLAHVCGAVAGATVVLGLKYGRANTGDGETKEKVYGLVRALADEFAKKKGSIMCRELLGYDISTPEGVERARREELFNTVCPECVRTAAAVLENLLDNTV